jgi:hypothetical protein
MIVGLGERLTDFTPLEGDGRVVGFRLHSVFAMQCGSRQGSTWVCSRLSRDFFDNFLARTIGDLAGSDVLGAAQVAEAIRYRPRQTVRGGIASLAG